LFSGDRSFAVISKAGLPLVAFVSRALHGSMICWNGQLTSPTGRIAGFSGCARWARPIADGLGHPRIDGRSVFEPNHARIDMDPLEMERVVAWKIVSTVSTANGLEAGVTGDLESGRGHVYVLAEREGEVADSTLNQIFQTPCGVDDFVV